MPRRGSDLLFTFLVLVAIVLTVLVGLVLSGQLVSDPWQGDQAAPPPPASKAAPRPQTGTDPATVTEGTPATRPVARAASVCIVATRGDCWVAAHAGSSDGPVLVARVLRIGEQVTLHARRIWLELGAAGNVDVTLNGKPRPIAFGTTNLLLG
jgi:uncharacterized protein DUF4115